MFFSLFFLSLSIITLSSSLMLSIFFLGVALFAFKIRNKVFTFSTQRKNHIQQTKSKDLEDFNQFEIGLNRAFLHNDD